MTAMEKDSAQVHAFSPPLYLTRIFKPASARPMSSFRIPTHSGSITLLTTFDDRVRVWVWLV